MNATLKRRLLIIVRKLLHFLEWISERHRKY